MILTYPKPSWPYLTWHVTCGNKHTRNDRTWRNLQVNTRTRAKELNRTGKHETRSMGSLLTWALKSCVAFIGGFKFWCLLGYVFLALSPSFSFPLSLYSFSLPLFFLLNSSTCIVCFIIFFLSLVFILFSSFLSFSLCSFFFVFLFMLFFIVWLMFLCFLFLFLSLSLFCCSLFLCSFFLFSYFYVFLLVLCFLSASCFFL